MKQLNFKGPRFQRGVLSFGFSDESTESTTQQNLEGTRRVNKNVRSDRDLEEETKQTTRLLSQELQDVLENLAITLTESTAGAASGGRQISDIATLLFDRAIGAQDELTEQNQAIIGEARRKGTKAVERLETDLAQAAGGRTSNKFVQLASAEGFSELESQLAALEAELGIEARNIQSQEFGQAIQAFATGAGTEATTSNAIAQIVQVLRGATQVTTGERVLSEKERELSSLVEKINQVVTGFSESDTSGFSIGF